MGQASVITAELRDEVCAVAVPPDTAFVVRHLAHELRQPLSTVEAAAYYLKLTIGGENSQAGKQIDRIEQMVLQMNSILADAVHFLQPAPPRPQWVDLTELLEDVPLPSSVEQCIEVDCSDGGDTPLVFMDPAQAQHMMRVLLQTLRQVAVDGQPVAVALFRDGAEIVLECSCEAGPELLERAGELLEPFTPHLPPGSGLALASVKRIAEVHQGRATVRGSDGRLRVEVILPAC